MIETKEQYKEMFRTTNYSRYFSRFVPGGWGVIQIEDSQDIIEALRNVARTARLVCRDLPSNEGEVAREAWGNTNTALVSLRLADTLIALDSLPAWVLEENNVTNS